MKKFATLSLPALALASVSGLASAASFQAWEQNASGIGTSFAGSAAVADNASTNYFNPAGLTRLTGFQFSGGVTGASSRVDFTGQGGAGSGDAGKTTVLGNAYVSGQISPDLYFGFGVSSPYAFSTEYGNWVGAQAQRAEMKTVNLNPSLAYRLNDTVSFGVGANYQRMTLDIANPTYRFKGDDHAAGWNAGALFTLSPAMRVGVAYRSSMDYKLQGSGTTVSLKTPDSFTLSVWQQVSDNWEAMGDLSWTRWSGIRQVAIAGNTENFSYRDAWRFAWGAAYKATDSAKYKFGIAYDRAPTRHGENHVAFLPVANSLWLSLGGQWEVRGVGRFDAGYAYQMSSDARLSQTVGGLTGEYSNSRHLLGMQYSVGF